MGAVGVNRDETHEVQEKAILVLLSDPTDEQEGEEGEGDRGQSWEQKDAGDASRWFSKTKDDNVAVEDDFTGECLPAVAQGVNHQRLLVMQAPRHKVSLSLSLYYYNRFLTIDFPWNIFPIILLLLLSVCFRH